MRTSFQTIIGSDTLCVGCKHLGGGIRSSGSPGICGTPPIERSETLVVFLGVLCTRRLFRNGW